MRKFLSGLLLLLATACAPFTTAAPLPTRQPVRVDLPPALRPWGSRLQACGAENPGMDLFVLESAPASQATGQADLTFHLGAPVTKSAYLAQVGTEDITILVNAANPNDKLSLAQLQQLYLGQALTWATIASAPAGFDQTVQLWTYPAGDELRWAFESAVFRGSQSQAQAMLAPDPQAMLEAVSSAKNAIGYVPGSWMKTVTPELAKGLKQIEVESALAQELRQPVLASSAVEPQGPARALLECLEK